jgi:hypothetical protein
MHPNDAVRVRAAAHQGVAVDVVADWFFDLLLAMEVSPERRLPGLSISESTTFDSRLAIRGHHQRLEAFYAHATKAGRLVGRITFCLVLNSGEIDKSILEFMVTDGGVSFDENLFISHYAGDQPNYDHIRHATAYRIMDALQRNMHEFEI